MSSFLGTDISCVWYDAEPGGAISYTAVGIEVYEPLFAGVGVDIRAVETVERHKEVVRQVVAKRQRQVTR